MQDNKKICIQKIVDEDIYKYDEFLKTAKESIKESDLYENFFKKDDLVIPMIVSRTRKKKKNKKCKSINQSPDNVKSESLSPKEQTIMETPIIQEEIKEESKNIKKELKESQIIHPRCGSDVWFSQEESKVLSLKKEAENYDIPVTDINISNIQLKTSNKKKRRKTSKGEILAKKEYEELKIRTLQLFTPSTSTGGKGKAKKVKKNKKKKSPCGKMTAENSVAPSFATPKRSLTPSKNLENCESFSKPEESSITKVNNRKSEPEKSDNITEFENPQDETEAYIDPPIFYDTFYLDENSNEIIKNLNTKISEILVKSKIYNTALFSVAESIRKIIEPQALRIFNTV